MQKLGFVVGRFQAPYLHSGYINMFEQILTGCDRFMIALSKNNTPPSKRNPFSVKERFEIIKRDLALHGLSGRFVGFIQLQDHPSDITWSNTLDKEIDAAVDKYAKYTRQDKCDPILFGSRDSFIPYYSGKTRVIEVESSDPDISSTQVRELELSKIDETYYADEKYLAGKLSAVNAQYPKVYPTVDIAIFNVEGQVLLGRKPNEDKWRFPGGFADPTDDSYEESARREAIEECGNIELGDFEIAFSAKIKDWRYRGEVDQIITTMFLAPHISGEPKGSDDLAEVKWYDLEYLTDNADTVFMPVHRELFSKLLDYITVNM